MTIKHSEIINKIEKKAETFGQRWADGYIHEHDVAYVFEEVNTWIKSLVDNGDIEYGYIRETYPKADVCLEIGVKPSDSTKLYFLKTEWYKKGDIATGFGWVEPIK